MAAWLRLSVLVALLLAPPAAASRDLGLPDESSVRDFFGRIATRFEQAERTGPATPRSSYLQGSGRAELTIGIISSPEIQYYSEQSLANWRRYAALHGYKLKIVEGLQEACGPSLARDLVVIAEGFANIWGKVCLLRSLLGRDADNASRAERQRTSHVMVIDADTFVQQPSFNIVEKLVHGELDSDRRAEGLMFDDRSGVNDYPNCWGSQNGKDGVCSPNTFLMLFKRGAPARAFARRWLEDAIGPCASDARQNPPTQRVLWHCTLPKTQQLHQGFLRVVNGMEQFYTMDIQDTQLPIVHFQEAKYSNAQGVRTAILAVDMPRPHGDS